MSLTSLLSSMNRTRGRRSRKATRRNSPLANTRRPFFELLEARVLLTAVANFDFEAGGVFTCCAATPSGWTHVSGGGEFWGVFPAPTFNPAFYPGPEGAGTQSGPMAAYFRNTSDIRIGQVLSDTLEPNTAYTLSKATPSSS